MIICPKCGHENDESAVNCSHCHINLQRAVENLGEEAQSQEAEAAEGQAPAPAPDKGRLELALGALVIVLRLTGVASVGLLLVSLLLVLFNNYTTGFEFGTEGAIGCVIGLLGAVASFVAARALLRGKRKPDIRRALPFLPLLLVLCGLAVAVPYVLVGVVGDSLHTASKARSVISGYKQGQRSFTEIDLSSTNLSRRHLRQIDLSHANLAQANLSRADLTGANLRKATLSGANMRAADLSGADLSGAYMVGVYLQQANLHGANLSNAFLEDADLSGADLTGADLTQANLSRANLTRAKVTAEQLAQAASLKGATMPDGSVHE